MGAAGIAAAPVASRGLFMALDAAVGANKPAGWRFSMRCIFGVWSDAFSFACRRSIALRLSRQASMRVAKWNTQKAIQRLSDLAAFQHKHARLFEGRWA